MRTQDFDFYLPDHLIAQQPAPERHLSRLLQLGQQGHLVDTVFSQLAEYVSAGDLMVFNDTRVIKARLNGQKETGGAAELLVERILDEHHVLAQIKASRAPKAGAKLFFADVIEAEVIGRNDDLFHVKFLAGMPVLDILEEYGTLPLPPYIAHKSNSDDEARYQTVYAKNVGAVAAPTAGLHFDDSIFTSLIRKKINIAYLTLHVGAGTFQPVRVDNIKDHKMHSEIYHIPEETVEAITRAKVSGNKVIAVGTTSLRALESAARHNHLQAGMGETDIFITPGFDFKVVDKLITNFHLPKSTLLMLVSAFAGYDNIRTAYAHAIEKEYRFFSYGDAMLLERV